jgi:hypothetical protein
MRHNNRVTGPYGIIRRLRAINQLRNALQELQELDPTGKLSGATDALMNRPPKTETGPYSEAYTGIRAAGIGGILVGGNRNQPPSVDY